MRVGIIGCGGIARAHAVGYRTSGRIDLVAFCDADEGRARHFAADFGGKTYQSAEDMFDDASLQAVSICTPPSSHEELTVAALSRGIHVCCEKPLAHSVEAARSMCEKAAETGALLVTAYKFRFFPNVLWAKDIIDSGGLGKVVFVRNVFAGYIDMSERWFSNKAISGGGVMLDNGVHSVDLLRFLFGEVRGVFAVTGNFGKKMEVEDSCRMMLDMESGVTASVDLSWATGGPRNILEIHGTKGVLDLTWDGGAFQPVTGDPQEYAPPEDPVGKDPFAAQLDWFVRCITGEKKPRATDRDGLRALEILERAYEASEKPTWNFC